VEPVASASASPVPHQISPVHWLMVRLLTTGDDGEEWENRDRGSSLDPGERPSSSLSEGCGMTSSGSAASGMRRRSRRMRRRSCTHALWAAMSTNCSGIGWDKCGECERESEQARRLPVCGCWTAA
jgi:hypothetical protein